MKLLNITEVQKMQLELMKRLHAFLQSNDIKYYLIAGSALGAVRHQGFIPWDDDIDIGMFRSDYEKFLSVADEFSSEYEIANYRNANNCDFGLTRFYFPNTYIEDLSITQTKLDKRLYFDVFPLDNVPDCPEELKRYEKSVRKKKKQIAKIDVRDFNNKWYVLLVKKMFSCILVPFRQRILRSFDRLMRKYEKEDTLSVCSLCSQYSFKKQVMKKDIYGTPVLHEFADAMFFVPEKIEEYLTILYGADYMQIPPVEKRRKGYNIYLTNEDE